jgi:hypothetical protein
MSPAGRNRGVERLIAELGRASSSLYNVRRQAPEAGDLTAARNLLTEAADWAARVAREPDDADLGVVAAAWEAIAVAQDLVAHSRHVTEVAIEQQRATAAVRAEAQGQAARARAVAERLRRWRSRRVGPSRTSR